MAEWMSGPRQMTGASPVRKYWMLIIFTPWLTTGFTRPELPVTWPSWVPIMSGTLGPVMSASRSPTERTVAGQADGQVDGDRRLAHPALAGRDRDRVPDAGDEVGHGTAEAALHVGRPLDAHRAGAHTGQLIGDIGLDLGLQRTGRGGELHGHRDEGAFDVDPPHHVQRHEVATDLGVGDPRQGSHDRVVGQHGGHPPRVSEDSVDRSRRLKRDHRRGRPPHPPAKSPRSTRPAGSARWQAIRREPPGPTRHTVPTTRSARRGARWPPA